MPAAERDIALPNDYEDNHGRCQRDQNIRNLLVGQRTCGEIVLHLVRLGG
jgi:hypothetical protein